ncbi:hypothetical protein [Tenacibaculum maritimum]|uniref:hypothetical protein n=1 Tax=Tenacibaculum maritimum TaxID=107401 RepID=UPI0012E44050|nr:hypothetical protein [Tenacibaculum maritimum]MCD9581257.1 hypothetical protein [Tenacibaculum maritimum]MCD9635234.1 hypothetical protein [Tenacibaculum maritimum]CAA0260693.1 conserved hypothetical protein [Tenacibaculum maritimum]
MDGTTIIKMLLIIKNNGSITELIKDGYTYGQVANMTTDLVKIGYIEEKEEALKVSGKGQEWLESNFKENKLKGSEKWIVPDEKSKIIKLKENEVYLPNRNELHF